MRPGTAPALRCAEAWLSRLASAESMSETSTRWPRPSRSRARRAARMPLVAKRPQIMSMSAAPTFSGRPSGSPVTDMSPLIACSSRS